MSNALYPSIITSVLMVACSPDRSEGPVVQDEAVFGVLEDEDIVYASGLGYDPRDDQTLTALDLTLDVYYPDNGAVSRPVFMWIHGGGFTGGSKTRDEIEEMAEFYATRGWVFVSINYRTTKVLSNGYDLCDEEDGSEHKEAVEFYRGIAPPEWTRFACDGADESLNFHQSIAMYSAQRDAKAALRWIVLNSNSYSIDLNYITVGGNSAGAITAATLGITDKDDFRDEIPTGDDPTLSATHLDETYTVQSMVWYWGSKQKLTMFDSVYDENSYDGDDPEIFMAHGPAEEKGESPTPYTDAVELQSTYDDNGIYSELVLLYCDGEVNPTCPYDTDGDGIADSWGHGAWGAQVDGVSLSQMSLDFIVKRQNLRVE